MSEQSVLLLTAIGTGLTALATAGLWLVGWRTLGGARDQLRLLQEQAKAEAADHITERLLAFMKAPRLLAPGSRFRVMWSYEKDGKPAGAPTSQKVTAVYHDDAGVEYRDEYSFVLDELLAASPVPTSGPRVTSGEDRALQNIDRAVRTLSEHVAELRR